MALVEKIINSVDAVLMRECLREGINPESEEAPKSIAEAQKKYFRIYNGKLSTVDVSVRSKIAENIYLLATGSENGENPCYSIVDLGEGQSPDLFPKTFLSLNRGNKSKVQFVQGKFGMGGTGVLRFGSPEHNLQLIISKRDPNIKESTKNGKWGVTLVRRIPPTGLMRSSIFTYLAPEGKILSFSADKLPLLPGDNLEGYKKPIEFGTFIKIYEYQIGSGRLKSDATRHLHNRLSLLMPNIALPIKIADIRYEKSPIKILSGLSVRLDEDKRENLEEGFPGSGEINIEGQKMDYSIYAFKLGKRETYAGEEGIIFTMNGQMHGFISKAFFDRKSVGMGYLSDSILVIVDCSKINRNMQEKLFMNSRDRLVDGPLQDEIKRQLEDIIKNHQGLRDLRERRKREFIENKLSDSKPLAEVMENIIKKSPSLTNLFKHGIRIKNPFNLTGTSNKGKFKGREFPTYFKLSKEYTKEKPKNCPINNIRFRVQYETDADNDYFNRDKEPGDLVVKINGVSMKDYSLNLWDGIATLNIETPSATKVGDILCFQTEVTDVSRDNLFTAEFCVKIENAQEASGGGNGNGERKRNPNSGEGKNNQKQDSLAIPNTYEIRKSEWEKHKFTEKSALKVVDGGEESGYDFYVNMDNVYLQMELKDNAKIDPKILEARFKYGMVLLGISLLETSEKQKENNSEKNGKSIYDEINFVSSAISPILLPMIHSLGEIEEI